MTTLRTALTTIVCIVLASPLKAQIEVQKHRPVAIDIETLQPVVGASVTGGRATVQTDSAGRFTPPDSSRTLVFSHVNYESRIVNMDELRGDTVFLISKLLSVSEVVVFGKGRYTEDGLDQLRRSLRMSRNEAALLNANPNGNLLGLVKYLIPKRWRDKESRKERRKRQHEEILNDY